MSLAKAQYGAAKPKYERSKKVSLLCLGPRGPHGPALIKDSGPPLEQAAKPKYVAPASVAVCPRFDTDCLDPEKCN